jgi:hypothetical protein
MTTAPTSTERLDLYTQTAQTIFRTHIVDTLTSGNPCAQGNWYTCSNSGSGIWRSAQAFDTLIDYFSLVPGDLNICTGGVKFAQSVVGTASDTAFDATKGAWWDDFGWTGIASLRAAYRRDLFPDTWQDFLKIAINCWCFMHGPGWWIPDVFKELRFPPGIPLPFPSLAGWAGKNTGIGAPNVWQSASPDFQTDFTPRFSPGGVWNAPFSTCDPPVPAPVHLPSETCTSAHLCGIQNTVTNAVFTILSLRLYRAAGNPDFRDIFGQTNLNLPNVLAAWQNQMSWFNSWFFGTDDENDKYSQSTLYRLSENYAPGQGTALIRERVSTFLPGGSQIAQVTWDPGYCMNLAWTGDQGLMLGALREASVFLQEDHSALGDEDNISQVSSVYKDILNGVLAGCYSSETISDGIGKSYTGVFLRPWVLATWDGSHITSTFPDAFPQGDNPDYQTGCGVFYRYLLQAHKADPTLSAPYVAKVLAAADLICQPAFPNGTSQDSQVCDCILSRFGYSGNDYMTAWINRLALLCMAIALVSD